MTFLEPKTYKSQVPFILSYPVFHVLNIFDFIVGKAMDAHPRV